MDYKNILVSVDLSAESYNLILKSVSIAKKYSANLYIIHIDVNYDSLYTGVMSFNTVNMDEKLNNEILENLKKLTKDIDYNIKDYLICSGKLNSVLVYIVNKYDIDLLVCGHHHDFLSKFHSSAKGLLDSIAIDMLITHINS